MIPQVWSISNVRTLVLILAALLVSSQLAFAQFAQQGPKLVGTGAVGPASQSYSVALSADGNTAIVGGWTDNSQIGAAWVFIRSGGVWTQQGDKLVGTGDQGWSIALSADGNTAIVGSLGSALVFTRSGGVWTQQGNWSAPARLEAPSKGTPSRCPPTAIPPSWAGLAIAP
jgi:hypothetical protein